MAAQLTQEAEFNEVMQMICDAARLKMKMNNHKGNITDITYETAIGLAKEEMDEMWGKIIEEDFVGTVIEAGDVMNFLVSCVVNANRAYRNRNKK